METELLQASNGDLFFLKSTNKGALEVKILKLEGPLDSQNFFESYTIIDNQEIKKDLLRDKRVRKNQNAHFMPQ